MRSRRQDLRGLKVLVVEDQILMAELLRDYLEDRGCTVVGPAARLGAGLDLARSNALDCALLDINLAGEMSFPIASVLRSRNIPFLFLTGYGPARIPLEFEGQTCMAKPVDMDELAATLLRKLPCSRRVAPESQP